jgi:hypothetical protein
MAACLVAAASPAQTRLDTRAQAALNRMLDALAAAPALDVRVEAEYDVALESGETLSFARVAEMTARRPDRLRIEASEGAEPQRVLGYDGRYLTLYDAGGSWFAAVERSANLDDVLTFVRDELGIELPLAPLFSIGLRSLLTEGVTSAVFVGSVTLAGEPHEHIALRYGDVGLQLWIPSAGDPLPRRLSLTFEGARGRPQLRADFRAWDLAPDVSERVFAFDPPEGVRAVPFALPARSKAEALGPAAGGLVSLERAKGAQQTLEADRAAHDTAARLEQASSRPRSGRPVVRRPGITTPAPASGGEIEAGGDGDADATSGPRVGTIVAAAAFAQMREQPDCALAEIEHAGARYARCRGAWYVEAVSGGELVWVAVEPPEGAPAS